MARRVIRLTIVAAALLSAGCDAPWQHEMREQPSLASTHSPREPAAGTLTTRGEPRLLAICAAAASGYTSTISSRPRAGSWTRNVLCGGDSQSQLSAASTSNPAPVNAPRTCSTVGPLVCGTSCAAAATGHRHTAAARPAVSDRMGFIAVRPFARQHARARACIGDSADTGPTQKVVQRRPPPFGARDYERNLVRNVVWSAAEGLAA